jgi:hypothetical protein
VLKNPWVPCLADDFSDPMVVATTAWEALRHGSASGTLGWSELARARCAGQGDFIFDYRGVAVANRDFTNVYGRSRERITYRPFRDPGDIISLSKLWGGE